MSTLDMQRSAYQQVCDESYKGLAEVTVMCPKCHKVLRTYEAKVNGFNEWAYKYAGPYDVSDRKKFRYYGTTMNGHGCCF